MMTEYQAKSLKEKIISSLKAQFNNEFSEEIYEQTYKFGNENIKETLYRISEYIGSNEKDKEYWTEQFALLLDEFKFVPGGRIISNAGIPIKGTTLLNCYVDGFEGENQDSIPGILEAIRKQTLILKSEGGYGFCADTMRPRGGFIEGIGNESPGAVSMLEMWDVHAKVITEGSGNKSINKLSKKKIRKGAQMVTMSCWHPDIEEFITKKQTPNVLTKFNMSVLITDEFIDAIKNNKSWDLIFPEFDQTPEWDNLKLNAKITYNKYWDGGNIKKWKELGYPIKIYKTYENANELWNKILTSTYNRNEPGILFIDTINRLNNLNYLEYINATNPCVVGDTLVLTNKGWIKIKNLKKNFKKQEYKIITRDKNGKLFNSELQDVMLTEKQSELYKISFSNGEFVLTNSKHKFYNENFEQIRINDIKNKQIISGNGLVLVVDCVKIDRKEDVYDLTAVPNYNFFSILNREEFIVKDDIIINDNIRLKYFDIVNTNKGQLFAYELTEEHELI